MERAESARHRWQPISRGFAAALERLSWSISISITRERLACFFRAFLLVLAELLEPRLAGRLHDFVSHLNRVFSCEVLVLDCHGGLDGMSVAAYSASDDTLVISEADTVAFNGTLELLDFYDANAPTTVGASVGVMTDDRVTTPGAEFEPIHPLAQPRHISFVVNRLPSKYRFADLDSTYRRLIANYHGDLAIRSSVLSFIPEEGFLAESFGEYPFPIKLAPKSVVARKIQLMMTDLMICDPGATVSYRPLQKLRSARFRRKVHAITVSAESRNTSNIVSAFGWLSIGFPVLVIASTFYIFAQVAEMQLKVPEIQSKVAEIQSMEAGAVAKPTNLGTPRQPLTRTLGAQRAGRLPPARPAYGLLAVLLLVMVACAYYVFRAQRGLMLYYHEKYKFRRALQRATGMAPNMWQTLYLVRLWLMRLGSALTFLFMTVVFLIYSLVALFALLAVLLELLREIL